MAQVSHVRAVASSLVFLVASIVGGCATGYSAQDPPPKNSSLNVSGPAGVQFTAEYTAAGRTDRVTTTLTRRTQSVMLVEFWEGDLECDIRKHDKSSTLTVTIFRYGTLMFLREAPAGIQGLRITHFWAGWKAELY